MSRWIPIIPTHGHISAYSNRCGAAAAWCLAAPGGDEATTGELWSTYPYSTYALMQGTSMASPVTAGAAVLVREAFPYMTARQIIQVMLTTTNRSGLWADESIYGRGLLDLGKAIDGPGEFGGEGFAPIFSVDTQGYDSVWRNDAAASDLLHVTGRADILGGVLELDGLQTHHVNQSFTFLQADGGVTLGPTY